MKTPLKSDAPLGAESSDLFSEVRPTGTIGKALDAIQNPRKHRWNSYLRACKNIPETSPVAGSTSFDKINTRRHEMIDVMFEDDMARHDEIKNSEEYRAIEKATSAWLNAPMIAQSFLMSRWLRRHGISDTENANSPSVGATGKSI